MFAYAQLGALTKTRVRCEGLRLSEAWHFTSVAWQMHNHWPIARELRQQLGLRLGNRAEAEGVSYVLAPHQMCD
jgi:hypothetical protein